MSGNGRAVWQVGLGVWFAAAILAAGCAHRGRGPEGALGEARTYYPLAVGHRWTYERALLGEKGTHTIEIVGIEGGAYVDNQGNRLLSDRHGVRDEQRYLLRDPVEVGREWTAVVSVTSVERYQILDVGLTCEVPAGTFRDCVRVEGRNRIDDKTTLVNELTFAPNVGPVRIEVFVEDLQKNRIPQARFELSGFRPAVAPPPPGTQPSGG